MCFEARGGMAIAGEADGWEDGDIVLVGCARGEERSEEE